MKNKNQKFEIINKKYKKIPNKIEIIVGFQEW